MNRLYNEYLAMNNDGKALVKKVTTALNGVITYYESRGFDLRDVENIIISSVSCQIGEKIIRRAIKMKKAKETGKAADPVNPIEVVQGLFDIVKAEYDHDPEPEDLPSWKTAIDKAEKFLKENT